MRLEHHQDGNQSRVLDDHDGAYVDHDHGDVRLRDNHDHRILPRLL
jgi:hypothetical protein